MTAERAETLQSAAASVSEQLPGDHHIEITKFDRTTSNPAVVESLDAPTVSGDFQEHALEHVVRISPVLGLTEQAPEFVVDPVVQEASSGARAVNLQQRYQGIPIFEAATTVRFAPDGTLMDTIGSTITVGPTAGPVPRLSVQEAVLAAARHLAEPDGDELGQVDAFGQPLSPLGVDVDDFAPQVRSIFADQPDTPAVLDPGPFEDRILASLVWFPLDEPRLAWNIMLTMPDYTGQYRTIVDAEDGRILYCNQRLQSVAAVGNVFTVDGAGSRTTVAFPNDWVELDATVGNSTLAHLGKTPTTFQGTVTNGAVKFDPSDAESNEQRLLNIFYYCCVMHDYMYQLNFKEADGNFQHDNLGRGGITGDRVDARSHPGAVFGTANMATPVDGSSPIMNMGLVTSTGRHTALDSTVVYHEFMHGVTNRLVGGPMNVNALNSIQSGGMGEGWGDYIACVINGTTLVGNWVVDNPRGIRGFPYDANFPDHFGALGTGRYDEVHNIGEIWCATLMELNRRCDSLSAAQLVVDALKLSPANPSFLDMRDAILAALENMRTTRLVSGAQHAAAWLAIWGSFAKFGMGPNATSNGAQLSGIKADFTVGEDEWHLCVKCQGLAFGGAAAGACPAGGGHDHTASSNYDLIQSTSAPGEVEWRRCAKCQGLVFGPAAGVCPAGGGHDHTGSGNYTLIVNAAGAQDQSGWSRCGKCAGLVLGAGSTQGPCPAGDTHDLTGSDDYTLLRR